jgi:hypothetical protein
MSKDGFGIDFDFKAFNGSLDELGKAVTEIVKKALIESGEQLRGDSVNIVPFKRGFNGGLAGSASTQLENDESVIVGFNMPYAAKLHEDMTLNISQKFAGSGFRRQQKYLEKPARENAQKYGRILAEAFRTYING